MKLKYVILLIGLLCSLSSFSQKDDYDSVEQLVNDIHSRRFEKPVNFMKRQIVSMESDTISQFQDTIYIGLVSLLATTYVQTNQPYSADSILSHAINYLTKTKRISSYAYSLYVTRGALLARMENYDSAARCLNPVVQSLKEKGEKGENYAAILSMLAECHRNLGRLDLAVKEIEESIYIIENSDGYYIHSNKLAIYQKAGAIYADLKLFDKAEEYTKQAYILSKNEETFVSEFINAAQNLATIYTNQRKYIDALDILDKLINLPLSEIEKTNVYDNIYLANYFLNNELETVKYADLCSREIRKVSSSFYSSFPTMTIENLWDKMAMQLMLNMGILEKFSSNSQALEMCYDNALFLKNLSFEQTKNLRNISKNNPEVARIYKNIQKLKYARLAGDNSFLDELNQQEKYLINKVRELASHNFCSSYNWKEVQQSLLPNEYAIEIITYSGFVDGNEDSPALKYGALILGYNMNAPIFVKLCTNKQIREVQIHSLSEREIGINRLYKKGTATILYDLIWKNIEPIVKDARTIYISPQLGLQSFNLGFIPCPDYKYINEKYNIQIVSSTSTLCKEKIPWKDYNIAIYGGIEYSKDTKTLEAKGSYRGIVLDALSDTTRGAYGFLHFSEIEADSIYALMCNHHYLSKLYKGSAANEESFRNLNNNSPSIIHIATHGFYLVGFKKYEDYFAKLIPYSKNDRNMLLSGLLFADANTALKDSVYDQTQNDGVLTAEEISYLDLSNTKLVVLSACESAVGVSMQEDIGGLLKAFKNAGAEHIIASLWDVPDDATSKLMISFYKQLVSGTEIHEALIKAQQEVAKLYPDPYYWASFILLD